MLFRMPNIHVPVLCLRVGMWMTSVRKKVNTISPRCLRAVLPCMPSGVRFSTVCFSVPKQTM